MKRGVGRGAGANGNGHTTLPPLPPGPPSTMTRYMQPPPPRRGRFGLFWRVVLGIFLVLLSLGLAAAGGAYLYFHQSVNAVQAHSTDVKRAEKSLDKVPSATEAAIALVIGYDHRAGFASDQPSRSDTLMLIRADPQTKTISLLSFPRDLEVPNYCPGSSVPVAVDRINAAYSRCGSAGTVLTVKHLTGLPINYLITVNFHGFKEVVDQLGGVWMDIDRRYYNKNTGAGYDNYANIDLQPGYQRLDGEEALSFVRFRHTDSDLVRTERQQEFVRAFKDQVSQNFSIEKVPGLVGAITHNIEVGEGNRRLSGSQVLSYAMFAFQLPHGHLFQDKINNVVCQNTCTVDQNDLQQAVQQFTNPDVQSSAQANAAALGKKVKQKSPPPSSVSVTVLNGNGQAGAASNASYLLAQRGYRTLVPPGNQEGNLPGNVHVFHTKIYYDPTQARSKAAATALQQLMQPADVEKLSRTSSIFPLDPGSMLMVVLGTTFHGQIGIPPAQNVPTHVAPSIRTDTTTGPSLLDQYVHRVPFKLETPTVLDRDSVPDTLPGDVPSRLYVIAGKHKAVRLVFSTGLIGEYWGIEETDWNDAPILGDRSFQHDLGGREFDLYYSGSHLHMVVLKANGATYWVVNSLSDHLSNETMLAIAKGLKPLTTAR